ncbi:Metallo-beta-lactamase superfamily protein [Pelagirhabdus alkalitolerans]|uniref:Metallo-beta-lactamase superfamily protein n=1 Tax=Pelagirhabdus alkalitolerans TaxID=1612202 RepID=A0A1G6KGI3_9BACI|nr:MBL fold metallo-hydrolase [Pelagirhabdus alkalitolerans]SDC30212.1 Metallo-beta-lactamase superfamily protein [Pelagirhabdus alkalitolerans]
MSENLIETIDLYDMNLKERTASYVLNAEKMTIIETSASPSIPHLLEGLDQRGIDYASIDYVIMTHVHLDHAGGVGVLLESLPNAKVIVHPRGKRHLADPSKLIKGTKAVYGDRFEPLFEPVKPVEEDRLIVKEDQETLEIGPDRTLTFYDTPGHAKHHLSIHDSLTNSMFTGDTLGMRYPLELTGNHPLILPSTSPNQFDPEDMKASIDRIEAMGVDAIYFGHYGHTTDPKSVYKILRTWIDRYVEISQDVLAKHNTEDINEQVGLVEQALYEAIKKEHSFDLSDVDPYLKVDLNISSQGIVDYLNK